MASEHEEERIIYMIRPIYLLQDIIRALERLGLKVQVSGQEGAWNLSASGEGKEVRISMDGEERVVEGLEVLGPVPVSHVRIRARGPPGFISALRYRLELELLRCLG